MRPLSVLSRLRVAVGLSVTALVVGSIVPRPAVAQDDWNDARTTALIRAAIDRRAVQLADTGLADYTAQAHGYLTFLAQLGEGIRKAR